MSSVFKQKSLLTGDLLLSCANNMVNNEIYDFSMFLLLVDLNISNNTLIMRTLVATLKKKGTYCSILKSTGSSSQHMFLKTIAYSLNA